MIDSADSGYWYVVPIVPDPQEGGKTPGKISGEGWCAWYGLESAVVRCPEAVAGWTQSPNGEVDAVLAEAGYTSRPIGRVGGL